MQHALSIVQKEFFHSSGKACKQSSKQSSTSENEFRASRSRSKTGGWGGGGLDTMENVTELAGKTTGKEQTVHVGRTDGRLKDARLSGQVCVTHTRPVLLLASIWHRQTLVPPAPSCLSPTGVVVSPGLRQRYAYPAQLQEAATVQ